MISKLEDTVGTSELFGNKAHNLGVLVKSGILVPKGFAIGLQEYSDYNSSGTFSDTFVRNISRFLQEINEPYAVRSSADIEDSNNRSYAGQFSTRLGVSKKDIFNAIRDVYSSIDYKKLLGYSDEENIKMGIVIQELVDADISGVLFSHNIINDDPNSILIELANKGCDKIVSGNTNPSLYVINKSSGEIYLYEEGDQRVVLDSIKIREIIQNAQKIENIFGKPQDIEFLFHKDRFYCLQSRPITTITK